MKKALLLVTVSLFAYILPAQIATNERPYGLSDAMADRQDAITLPIPDRVVIAHEDSINDNRPGPLRYAYPVKVSYTLENSGAWYELEDGSKIWRLRVKLPEALSTNALYDKFWLPKGVKFFVYSEDTEQYIGAITSDYIGGSRENPIAFASAIIYGESVVFEYYQPASVSDSAVISISRIDYGYRYVNNPYVLRGFGDSESCHVNINCSEGNNWQTEKHAVARVNVSGPEGSGWCSCALVNNTNNDLTPYVLTADHCLAGLDAITNNNASQWIFYWEYEHSGCDNSYSEPTLRTTTGATVVANNSSTDFALVLLTQNPHNVLGVTPYYLGWDRSGNAGTSGVGIHHPKGDVKKISAANQILNYSGSIIWDSVYLSAPNTHWAATFYNGYIEGGSSGSPLINNSHRVIGQLHGGYAVCNTNYVKFYGKFDVSWTGNGAVDNRRKLQPWLDPAGTNPTTLDGRTSILAGPSFFFSSGTFTLQNVPSNATVTYSVSSGLTASKFGNEIVVYVQNSSGQGWLSVNVSYDGKTISDVMSFAYSECSIEAELFRYVPCSSPMEENCKSYEWCDGPNNKFELIFNCSSGSDMTEVSNWRYEARVVRRSDHSVIWTNSPFGFYGTNIVDVEYYGSLSLYDLEVRTMSYPNSEWRAVGEFLNKYCPSTSEETIEN
jgi:hypothetical protein